MTGRTLTTRIVFAGVDNVSKVLGGISQRVAGASKSIEQTSRRFRQAGTTAGSIGLPVAFGVDRALRKFAEFNSALIENKALLDGNADATERLRKQAVKLAGTTRFSGTDVLKTQAEVIRSGRSEEDARALTPAILNQSIVTKIEPSIIADKLTNIIGSTLGDIKGEELGRAAKEINDRLAFTANTSNQTPLEALNFNERFAPISKVADINADQSASFSQVLANSGFKGREGANALRTIILRLNAPTKAARQAFADLGIQLDSFVSGAKKITSDATLQAIREAGLSGQADQAGQVAGILNNQDIDAETRIDQAIERLNPDGDLGGEAEQKLRESLNRVILQAAGNLNESALLKAIKDGGVSTAQINDIFGKQRAAQGAALVDGADKIISGEIKIRDGSINAIQRMLAVLRERFELPFQELRSAIENLSNTIVGANSERIIAFVNRLREGVNSLQQTFENNPALARFAASVGVAAIAIPPLLIGLGLMAQGIAALGIAFAFLLKPLKLIGRALALVKPLFTSLGKGAELAKSGLLRLGGIAAVAAGGIAILSDSWERISNAFGKINFGAVFTQLGNAISAFAAGDHAKGFAELERAVLQLKTAFTESFAAIGDSIRGFIDGAFPNLGPIIDGFKEGFNFNGIVEQSGKLGEAIQKLSDAGSKLASVFTFDEATQEQTARWVEILKAVGESFGRFVGLGIETALDVLSTAVNGLATALNTLVDAGERFATLDIAGGLKEIASGIGEGGQGLTNLASRTLARAGEQLGLIPKGEGKFGVFGEQVPKLPEAPEAFKSKPFGNLTPQSVTINTPQIEVPKPANSNVPTPQIIGRAQLGARRLADQIQTPQAPLRQINSLNTPPRRTPEDIQSIAEIRRQTQATEAAKAAVDQSAQKIDGTNARLDRVITGIGNVATGISGLGNAVRAASSNNSNSAPRPERLSGGGLQPL